MQKSTMYMTVYSLLILLLKMPHLTSCLSIIKQHVTFENHHISEEMYLLFKSATIINSFFVKNRLKKIDVIDKQKKKKTML